MVSGVRHGYPCFSRDENDSVRARHCSFIANRYRGVALLKNKHLLGIMVFVEINDGTGLQIFCQHNEIFGCPILLIDLNDEFRNGARTIRLRLSFRAA